MDVEELARSMWEDYLFHRDSMSTLGEDEWEWVDILYYPPSIDLTEDEGTELYKHLRSLGETVCQSIIGLVLP